MRLPIKKYVLNETVTEEVLKSCGFKYKNDGSVLGINTPLYYFFKYLIDDIELHIEISINQDKTLSFDDFDNVLLLDDDFCQPYHPFYKEEVDTPFINEVIQKYNEAMDELVNEGILKEVTKEIVETSKNSMSRKRT